MWELGYVAFLEVVYVKAFLVAEGGVQGSRTSQWGRQRWVADEPCHNRAATTQAEESRAPAL